MRSVEERDAQGSAGTVEVVALQGWEPENQHKGSPTTFSIYLSGAEEPWDPDVLLVEVDSEKSRWLYLVRMCRLERRVERAAKTQRHPPQADAQERARVSSIFAI
jgi:hypothetical protein